MLTFRWPARAQRRQRGLSLVELMVGVAVGLFVVAGATTVVVTQLTDTRRLVIETQIQQDMRAAADIMTRELRRAGYWSASADSNGAVWSPSGSVGANPNTDLVTTASSIEIAWDSGGAVPAKGFRLSSASPGVLQLKDGAGAWQDLTDKTTVDITGFTVQVVPLSTSTLACPASCAGGGQACWPTVTVREVRLQITGQSLDRTVTRTLVSAVRLRNDKLVNNNGGGPLCPA